MRCLAGAPVWRSGGITAMQWFGSGVEGAGVALGCRSGGGMARGGLQGVRAPIKAGTGVWACVHGVIAPEIAVAQDAEETDRATISRDPGLGWGSFWKLSAHGRLSSGSCRAGWSTAQRASAAETAQRGRREVCGRRKGKQLTCGPA